MNIEFHAPKGLVKEWLIDHIRERLIQMHQVYPAMSRVQINFRLRESNRFENIMELDIPEFGSSFFVRKSGSTVERAIRSVLDELQNRVEQRVALEKEPPDSITSTVDIS